MDLAKFWQLIDKARTASGDDPRKQSDVLTEELSRLDPDEIISFQLIFASLMDQAYTADLWEACFVIDCGCSDDGFSEWREWLIGRGKEVFDKALADPESLADVVEVGSENVYPTMLGVARKAYERATGHEMPPQPRHAPELKGELHDESYMLERYPSLTAKYWKWWLDRYGIPTDQD